MIQCNSFELVYLKQIPYLIPYGQQSANLKKSIRLNETGVMIWNGLMQNKTMEQILQDIANTYELSENDLPFVREDLYETVAQLEAMQVITNSDKTDTAPVSDKSMTNQKETKAHSFCFHIGPLTICCKSSDITALSAFFKDFICFPKEPSVMQTIVIKEQKPKAIENKITLVDRADILIEQTPYCYRICVPDKPEFYEMHIAKDASFVEIFCKHTVDAEFLFHMIRFPVLLLAQTKGYFFLHSASILFQQKAWLFSGSSGTGKSTHTGLWHTFLGTPYLNGDLNMIGMENNQCIVYGQPWCGTSKIYTAMDHPLGGIVFLKQADKNHWQSMSSDQQVLHLLYRLISPNWTKDMLHRNIAFSKKVSKNVPLFSLECTPDKEACYAAKDGILFYLKNDLHCENKRL